MVFSLREKNIHDKQANEVAMLDMHRQKEVVKLREACKIVVEHLRRSHIDPEDRDGKIKTIVEWFTMLLYAFLEHMRCQYKKLDLQQTTVWTKELQSKENFHQGAKFGQLDHTFDQHVPLPDSGFTMEEFSHFSCCVDTATEANRPQSLDDSSVMEITLVRSVIPSEVINAEAGRNGSAEAFIHTEGGLASEGIGVTESRIHNSSDGIDSQGGASLAVQDPLSSNPPIDNSINQESSSGDNKRTEHVEGESGFGLQPLLGGTDQHFGDAELEVHAGNTESAPADPPHSEPRTVAPVLSQASLPISKEVQTQTNLVMQSAQSSVAPARLLQGEVEQAGLSGVAPAQPLQPEMQPSMSREVQIQTDLVIQSAQPSVAPAQHPQGEVEQAGLSRVASAHPSLPEMQPSIPVFNILLERTCLDKSQPSHQPEAASGSAQSTQLFLVASMMFNHPPVGDEPLKNELHRLRLYIDLLNKIHELKQSQLQTECSQEIEKIKPKYDLLLQEQDSTHLQQRKTLADLCEKVLLNQSLADDFRAKFISSSAAQARDYSPPIRQTPQVSQQILTRPSGVSLTAPPIVSPSTGRPPRPIHHVQPSQVHRPSSSPQVSRSSSPSSLVVRSHPSIPGNLVRSTSAPFSHTQVQPRGSYEVQSELARAPAPHLQCRLPPRQHSMAPANQQQLPARLEGTSARTQLAPVTPVNVRPSCSHAASLVSTSPSILHPAILAPLKPSSSHPTRQLPLAPSIPIPALQAIALPCLCTSSAASDALPSRCVGPSVSGTQQSSDSASLDAWLTDSLGLSSDPHGAAAHPDVVCLSDDE